MSRPFQSINVNTVSTSNTNTKPTISTSGFGNLNSTSSSTSGFGNFRPLLSTNGSMKTTPSSSVVGSNTPSTVSIPSNFTTTNKNTEPSPSFSISATRKYYLFLMKLLYVCLAYMYNY